MTARHASKPWRRAYKTLGRVSNTNKNTSDERQGQGSCRRGARGCRFPSKIAPPSREASPRLARGLPAYRMQADDAKHKRAARGAAQARAKARPRLLCTRRRPPIRPPATTTVSTHQYPAAGHFECFCTKWKEGTDSNRPASRHEPPILHRVRPLPPLLPQLWHYSRHRHHQGCMQCTTRGWTVRHHGRGAACGSAPRWQRPGGVVRLAAPNRWHRRQPALRLAAGSGPVSWITRVLLCPAAGAAVGASLRACACAAAATASLASQPLHRELRGSAPPPPPLRA